MNKIDFFQKEIEALRPMEGEMLGQIQDYYRVGLTWTSNALEGNSLTESETKVLLEDGLTVGGKPLRDVFEAVDHAKAYDFMFSVFQNRLIDERTVLKMHELFYQNIEPEYAGRYRNIRVLITGSQYSVATPEKVQKEMDGLFAWVRKERAHRDDRDFMEFIAEREFESQKEMLRLFGIPFPREGQESV